MSVDYSLQVHVDKGMNDGQKLTFRGEGDQEVGKRFVYEWLNGAVKMLHFKKKCMRRVCKNCVILTLSRPGLGC